MFSSKYQGGPVREIGIGGFNLSDENIKQLTLFEAMLEDDKQVSKQEALQQEVRAYDSESEAIRIYHDRGHDKMGAFVRQESYLKRRRSL